jgi:glycerate 2-kinase
VTAGRPLRVVVAPDSFKGSLGAAGAAAALAEGWLARRPGDEVTRVPLADGGEGTLDVLAAAGPVTWHQATVTGPGGDPVECAWLELPDRVAVMELARSSGLPLLRRPDPLGAHTLGLGETIGHALDAGAREVVVTLGDSASTDGGTGVLAALGARFLDHAGHPLPPGGGALTRLAAAGLADLRRPPPGGVTCLTDVTAPLLGRHGAAATYGPQKGADEGQIALLESGLARLAAVLGGDPGAPGAGAAGGTGYGLATGWQAVITPGAPRLCELAGLDRALAAADLVITGEGRFDETSLAGKVTGTVLAAAAARGVPAALVAGQIAAGPGWPGRRPPVTAVALDSLAGGTERPLADPRRWLHAAAGQLAARQRPLNPCQRPLNPRRRPAAGPGRPWALGWRAPGTSLAWCGRSRCSAAAPTPSWHERSAPCSASRCCRSGSSGSPTTAWRSSSSRTAANATCSSSSR